MRLFPITRDECVKELERELTIRGSFYGRKVAEGKMTREKADYQMDCLRVAIRRLRAGPDFADMP